DPGTPGLTRAEATRARAGVAEDHESRRARAPALRHVRAVSFLAYGMKRLRPHQPPKVFVLRPHWETDLEPVRPRAIDRHDRGRGASPPRAGPAPLPR